MHNQGTKGVGGQHQAPSAYQWEGDANTYCPGI